MRDHHIREKTRRISVRSSSGRDDDAGPEQTERRQSGPWSGGERPAASHGADVAGRRVCDPSVATREPAMGGPCKDRRAGEGCGKRDSVPLAHFNSRAYRSGRESAVPTSERRPRPPEPSNSPAGRTNTFRLRRRRFPERRAGRAAHAAQMVAASVGRRNLAEPSARRSMWGAWSAATSHALKSPDVFPKTARALRSMESRASCRDCVR